MFRLRATIAGATALTLIGGGFVAARRSATVETTPPGIARMTRSETLGGWLDEGFVPMVTPIRGPTSLDGRVRTVVLVRLPRGPTIGLGRAADGVPVPIFPPGSEAVRLELLADGARDVDVPERSSRILDARGSEIGADDERFYVLRPSAERALAGFAWARSDPSAPARATRVLRESIVSGELSRALLPDEREKEAKRLAGLNDCASCHEPNRAARPHAVVKRATDTRGFFTPRSVFSNRDRFETYRPRNPNRDDPRMDWLCDGVRREAPCARGEVAEGEYDLRSAVAAGDAHATAVCASRRSLAAAFDDAARAAFASALDACAR